MCLPKAPPITQMSVDKDRLQAQTDRNGNVQRQPPLRRRYDLARRKMENDLDMKTACEKSAKSTSERSVENRMIARLTPFSSSQVWNQGMKAVDRDKAINTLLRTNKLYKLTPEKPGIQIYTEKP